MKIEYLLPRQSFDGFGYYHDWVSSDDVVLTGRYKIKNHNEIKTLYIEVRYIGYKSVAIEKKFLWLIPYTSRKNKWKEMTGWIHEKNIDMKDEIILDCDCD